MITISNKKEIIIDRKGYDTTFVFFGGLAGELGIPHFEFKNITKDLKADTIFVRDLRQAWYSYGLKDSKESFEGTYEEVVKVLGDNKKIFVGNSSGGFIAILIGSIIADKIITFSPQTFIDKETREEYNDNRWQPDIDKVHKNENQKPYSLDLDNFFMKTPIDIHYSKDDELDKIHARRLEHKEKVNLIEHDLGDIDHDNLAKVLRNKGQLEKILQEESENG